LVGLVHFVFQSRWRSVVIKDENGKFQCEKTGNVFRDCNDDPLQPSVHLPAGLGCILFEHFCRNFYENIWTLSKWNCNNDWSNILFNSDSSFASLEILLTVSYYLVLVGFGSGFTGLSYIYLTDIFYGSGKLCRHANHFVFR